MDCQRAFESALIKRDAGSVGGVERKILAVAAQCDIKAIVFLVKLITVPQLWTLQRARNKKWKSFQPRYVWN